MTLKKARPVSDLKSHTGFWMRFVSNHVTHGFAQRVMAEGVTVAEWVILRELFDVDAVAPSAVAETTGLTRGAVSKLVDRLLAKKLLTRREAAGDRRYQQVSLTAAGRALVPKLAALADRNDEEFFSHLTIAEHTQLVKTLKKLVQANDLSTLPVE